MSLRYKIILIKKWVSLIEDIFKIDDYSKLENDTVVGLELKIENILKIYQQESVNLKIITYKSHDEEDFEIIFSQGSDCKEKKTCFNEILNIINNNVDELLNLKTLHEFINYAEENKTKETEQRYQQMSKETIEKRLVSFKILNKYIIEILITIFDTELNKELAHIEDMKISDDSNDNKIKEFIEKRKPKYLKFFDNHKSYIEDILIEYEEFSLYIKEMENLKCTEKVEIYSTKPLVKILSGTPERKPLKRRRTTLFEDIQTKLPHSFSCTWLIGNQYNVWPKHKKRPKDRSNSAPPKFSYTIDINRRPKSISSDECLTNLFNEDWSQDTEVWDGNQTPQIEGY